MKLPYREEKSKIRWAGFILRAALILLTLAVVAAVRLPAQVRGYTYELYREAAGANMDFRSRHLMVLEGEHVRVKYQETDSNYAGMVLEAAEKFYRPVATKYGLKTGRKVTVVIYPTREELNASFGWPASESAMGVYWAGVIRVLSPASWVNGENPEEIKNTFINVGPMAHELTHLAVDYATRGNCPRWLTEGLAQLEEYRLTGFRFDDLSAAGSGAFYSLKEMDRGFDDLPDQALAYREALSAVEYIDTVHGGDKLMKIISLLGAGRGIGESVKEALGVDLATLEQNWRTWSGF
ncbi:MAG: peptidase MA family metallohydrolase [Bacillota bacterium]